MPSLTLPECARYIPPPETKEDCKIKLYPQLRDALRTHGFIYAINHGYTQAQRDRIFDIAGVPFNDVSPDEKRTYTADVEKVGYYAGYKPRQSKVDTENQILDQIEHYAINLDIAKRPHPTAVRPFLPEINDFTRHNHFNILHPILRLIALSLELPEETLVEKHNFDRTGETSGDYRRSTDDEEKSKNVCITILWSQPIGGLQIMAPDGKWKWVRHIDNGLVINTGDMMTFLTGGYYKPTIHRVIQPPSDQRAYDRLARILLCDARTTTAFGIERQCPDEDAPSTVAYGRVDLKKGWSLVLRRRLLRELW
ncbi:hypothetical protein EDD22DRAFT_978288 [Suillus occidentalis]|nr:hypothetical protein EDD22DRAFT_978288 [Suillus occidentalis]